MGCTQGCGQKSIEPGRATRSKNVTFSDQVANNTSYQDKIAALSRVMLFKRLPKIQFPLLAAACQVFEYRAGQAIIREGEIGSAFFYICSGEASASVLKCDEAVQVAVLKVGDYFGENTLLRDEVRVVTIIAETAVTCLKITRHKFQQLHLHGHLQFVHRKAACCFDSRRVVHTKVPAPKTKEDIALITGALLNNAHLQTMGTLDQASINQIIGVLWKEDVPGGTEIITEGDTAADYFYIIQEGSFEVLTSKRVEDAEKKALARSNSLHLATLTVGESFGELALLYSVPRAATVKAVGNSAVWVIDRSNFKNILMNVSESKFKAYVQYLNRVDLLNSLLATEKKAVAKALVEMHFTEGQVILQQCQPERTFYILYEGEVAVTKDDEEQERLIASHCDGTSHAFGQGALIDDAPSAATVRVTSDTAKALALDRSSFDMLLGPLQDVLHREGGKAGALDVAGRMPKGRLQSVQRIRQKDLCRVGLLGCGAMSSVELWKHKKTGDAYALKGLSKGHIVTAGMQESIMNEKSILMMTNSEFIIKLYAAFNGRQTLYLLLEPALGGELYATYNRHSLHGKGRHAQYYTAAVVLAFVHCHERHIIYRDLKPENLLLDTKGHLKLSDMGLSKCVLGKTYTTCGIPDYFAPEIISSVGHTKAVDWWMLGVLLFELLSGHPPFESGHPMKVYSRIMGGISTVLFPDACAGSAEALIKGLLKLEPSQRLPMRPGGVANLKDTNWYHGFDWDAMEHLSLEPPFVPVVKSNTDIANFHARKEDAPEHIEYQDDGSGWDSEFAS